jgi:predicted RNA-binding Zn-ribbon protein involved in translation (DUF1610 family)
MIFAAIVSSLASAGAIEMGLMSRSLKVFVTTIAVATLLGFCVQWLAKNATVSCPNCGIGIHPKDCLVAGTAHSYGHIYLCPKCDRMVW